MFVRKHISMGILILVSLSHAHPVFQLLNLSTFFTSLAGPAGIIPLVYVYGKSRFLGRHTPLWMLSIHLSPFFILTLVELSIETYWLFTGNPFWLKLSAPAMKDIPFPSGFFPDKQFLPGPAPIPHFVYSIIYTIIALFYTLLFFKKTGGRDSGTSAVSPSIHKLRRGALALLLMQVLFAFFLFPPPHWILQSKNSLIKSFPLINVFIETAIALTIIYLLYYFEIHSPTGVKTVLDSAPPSGGSFSPKPSAARYSFSRLSDTRLARISEAITGVMEEDKPYLDSEFKMEDLSRLTNIPRFHISQALNVYMKTNFYSFVNGYRIKEIKKEMENEKGGKLNFLNLAFKYGFNSKSTFQKVFKETTGMTPRSYYRSLLEDSPIPLRKNTGSRFS